MGLRASGGNRKFGGMTQYAGVKVPGAFCYYEGYGERTTHQSQDIGNTAHALYQPAKRN